MVIKNSVKCFKGKPIDIENINGLVKDIRNGVYWVCIWTVKIKIVVSEKNFHWIQTMVG